MRIYRIFLILFVAATCMCSTVFAATPRRVLPAAISTATNTDNDGQNRTPHDKNTNVSTRSRTSVSSGVKSRAATSENITAGRSTVSRAANAPAGVATRNAVVARAPAKSVSNRNANATRPTVSARAASNATTAPNAALQSMLDTADANSKCLESYTQCMDNYCNVLDADLGRCSCSGDITQFSKISDMLSATNVELQDVMKKISYIGLSADEITAMYTQTAAESVMGTVQDTSKTKSDLEAIKGMLVDVKSQSSKTDTTDNDISGLLNLDLTQNNSFDVSGILGNIGATNSSPLSNQRGEQLYKSAAARCKSSILKNCIDAQPDVVESRYQTEISRACTAYGKALQEKNDAARRMINNAERVLQTARLKVQSEKDSYDLRGCVGALDSCMRDDFVCGSDYGQCLDATGRYFVSGQLVSGASESAIMTGIWGVAEPGGDANFIKSNATGGNIANLIAKIGNPIRRDGFCSNVLNKCQSQWRNGKSDSYNTMNNVVLAWLGDAIPKMVVQQRTLINDFRSDCVSTVNTCMTQQGVPNNLKPRNMQSVISGFLAGIISACRTQIDMCANVTNMTTSEILAEYIQTNVCSGYDAEIDVCNPSDDIFKITTTEMAAGTTFNFKMSAAGRFTVNWGDGTTDEIVRNDTTEQQYSHTYTTGGVRKIMMTGTATGYSTERKQYNIPYAAISFMRNPNVAKLDGSLGKVFPTIGDGASDDAQPRFYQTFHDCGRLTSIPGNLFDGVHGAADRMFYETFSSSNVVLNIPHSCVLTSIPENLFSGVHGASEYLFYGTFDKCRKITSIPENLFSGVSGAAESMFSGTFLYCSGLTKIPENLFSGVRGAADSMFDRTFASCYGLTEIPEKLFSGVSGAAEGMFSATFWESEPHNHHPQITKIPANLFAGVHGAAARMFTRTFAGQTKLETIPTDLFAGVYVSNSTDDSTSMFYRTFYGCNSLTGPSSQISVSGVKKYLYELWPNSGNGCYYNATQLSDYGTIPDTWK